MLSKVYCGKELRNNEAVCSVDWYAALKIDVIMQFTNTAISSDDRGKAYTLLLVLIWLFNLSCIADIDVVACLIKMICDIGAQMNIYMSVDSLLTIYQQL